VLVECLEERCFFLSIKHVFVVFGGVIRCA
jgi:hypothetical protein